MSESFSPAVEYLETRTPDRQYGEALRTIRDKGRAALSGMDEGSTEYLGITMRFDLENGFPLITQRDVMRGTSPSIIESYESNPARRPFVGAAKQAMGEIIGFMNGARTQEELEAYGCKFWAPWTVGEEAERKAAKRGLEVGDLGPGSYGAAFHDFPTQDGGTFDQYGAVVEQIKDRPELRTHYISPFIPDLTSRAPGRQQKVLIVPCHGQQHFNVDVENQEISLVHWQRSGDMPVGVPFNLAHYAGVLMMVGQVTNLKPREVIHQVSNAHYYDRHKDIVDELIEREPFAFPKVHLNPDVKRLEDFRAEDFEVEEYYAHPPINMGGTAV